MSKDNKIGLLEMVLAMFLMGTVGYFVLESKQTAYNVVFYRCLFGAFCLFIYCWMFGYFKGGGLSKNVLLKIAVSGLFLIVNWMLLFTSFKLSSLSTATVVYHVQPFFFIVIRASLMREKIPPFKFFWMAVAFCGLIFVSNLSVSDFSFSSSHFQGVALALLAALFWAISAVMVKRIKNIKPHLIVLVQMVIGVIVLYPFADFSDLSNIALKQWTYLFILGAIHSCLTYILMYSSYQTLTSVSIAILTFIYPAVAIVTDFIVYD